jgi:hypothetical protein
MSDGIFISYQVKDSAALADRLYDYKQKYKETLYPIITH